MIIQQGNSQLTPMLKKCRAFVQYTFNEWVRQIIIDTDPTDIEIAMGEQRLITEFEKRYLGDGKTNINFGLADAVAESTLTATLVKCSARQGQPQTLTEI